MQLWPVAHFLTVSSSRSLTNHFFFSSSPFVNFRYFYGLSFSIFKGLLFSFINWISFSFFALPFSNWTFISIFLNGFFSPIFKWIYFQMNFFAQSLIGLICPIFKRTFLLNFLITISLLLVHHLSIFVIFVIFIFVIFVFFFAHSLLSDFFRYSFVNTL